MTNICSFCGKSIPDSNFEYSLLTDKIRCIECATQTITILTWQQFETACQQIASRVKQHPKTINKIYGIPRGGIILAVCLSYLLDLPLITDPTKITLKTLICDDISDTGKTLLQYKNKCLITTIFYHKQSAIIPDIWIYEKTSAWIKFPWEKE